MLSESAAAVHGSQSASKFSFVLFEFLRQDLKGTLTKGKLTVKKKPFRNYKFVFYFFK